MLPSYHKHLAAKPYPKEGNYTKGWLGALGSESGMKLSSDLSLTADRFHLTPRHFLCFLFLNLIGLVLKFCTYLFYFFIDDAL